MSEDETKFIELLEELARQFELMESIDKPFFLDHIIVPGEREGDYRYEDVRSIPQMGSGVSGFYENKPYLFRVIGFTFYESEFRLKRSKSIGALLIEPVAPSDLAIIKPE